MVQPSGLTDAPMSFRTVMLVAIFTALSAGLAFVGVVLWSGRGILEGSHANPEVGTEWMTVTDTTYELRGVVYRTIEALSTGLSQLQPKPRHVSVRWVAAADPASSSATPSAQVQQAREALLKEHIATPGTVVGNEVFTPNAAASSGAR